MHVLCPHRNLSTWLCNLEYLLIYSHAGLTGETSVLWRSCSAHHCAALSMSMYWLKKFGCFVNRSLTQCMLMIVVTSEELTNSKDPAAGTYRKCD